MASMERGDSRMYHSVMLSMLRTIIGTVRATLIINSFRSRRKASFFSGDSPAGPESADPASFGMTSV